MPTLSTSLAVWFGCGLSPKAPGTIGSLAAIPLVWLLMLYGNAIAVLGFTLFVSLVGWWAAEQYVQHTGKSDPSEVVIDEVAGQSLTYGLTFLVIPPSWLAWLLGFALFRLFDIVKRGPVGWMDRNLHGGLGIMADDLVAGILAAGATIALMEGANML